MVLQNKGKRVARGARFLSSEARDRYHADPCERERAGPPALPVTKWRKHLVVSEGVVYPERLPRLSAEAHDALPDLQLPTPTALAADATPPRPASAARPACAELGRRWLWARSGSADRGQCGCRLRSGGEEGMDELRGQGLQTWKGEDFEPLTVTVEAICRKANSRRELNMPALKLRAHLSAIALSPSTYMLLLIACW